MATEGMIALAQAVNSFGLSTAEALGRVTGDEWIVVRPAGENDIAHLCEIGVRGGDHDGDRIRLAKRYDEEKFSVSGVYPDEQANVERVYLPRDMERPSINVSPARSANTVARDINRRFLPKYRELLAYVTGEVEKSKNAERERRALADRLADALGVSRPKHDDANGRPRRSTVNIPTDYPGWGGFETSYGGKTCELSLRTVDADTAVAIAKLLRDRHETNKR